MFTLLIVFFTVSARGFASDFEISAKSQKSMTLSENKIVGQFCSGFIGADRGTSLKRTLDIVKLTRDNITQAQLPNGRSVPAETKAELQYPIVSGSLATCIVSIGAQSALADLCGFDVEARIYSPFMKLIRRELSPSAKQIAFVGLLHGVSMGRVLGEIQQAGADSCPPGTRDRLDRQLPKSK